MDYQRVQFSVDKEPTFEIVPPPATRIGSGAQALQSRKKLKVDPKGLSMGPMTMNNAVVNAVSVVNKKRRPPDTPFNPFSDISAYVSRARYVMTLAGEANIQKVEYSPVNVEEMEILDDVDDPPTLTSPGAAQQATLSSTLSLSTFQSIVPAAALVSGSAMMLEDSEDQFNSYHFLNATQNQSIALAAPVTVSPTWSAILGDEDATYEWLWGFLADTGATNIQMSISGGTDDSPAVASIFDITVAFSFGKSTSLTFKSSNVLGGFNINSTAGVTDSYGFLENGAGMLLGLSTATSGTFKLRDLLALVGIQDSLLDGDTELVMCSEKRNLIGLPEPLNGMWYYPQNNNNTVFTIWAQPSVPTQDRLVGVDIDIPGCHFSDSTIIVTKSGSLTSAIDSSGQSDDYVCSTGSFCLQTHLDLGSPAISSCQCWISVFPTGLSLTLQWVKVSI